MATGGRDGIRDIANVHEVAPGGQVTQLDRVVPADERVRHGRRSRARHAVAGHARSDGVEHAQHGRGQAATGHEPGGLELGDAVGRDRPDGIALAGGLAGDPGAVLGG